MLNRCVTYTRATPRRVSPWQSSDFGRRAHGAKPHTRHSRVTGVRWVDCLPQYHSKTGPPDERQTRHRFRLQGMQPTCQKSDTSRPHKTEAHWALLVACATCRMERPTARRRRQSRTWTGFLCRRRCWTSLRHNSTSGGVHRSGKHTAEKMRTEVTVMMVLHMSASTVHIHRLNILITSVTLHVSRVGARATFVVHVECLSLWRGHCQRLGLG